MPTKKKAKSRAANTRIAGRSTGSRLTNASIEEQIAFLASQIALLRDQCRLQTSDFRLQEKAEKRNLKPEVRSLKPEVRSPKPEALPNGNNTTTFLQTWLEEQHVNPDLHAKVQQAAQYINDDPKLLPAFFHHSKLRF